MPDERVGRSLEMSGHMTSKSACIQARRSLHYAALPVGSERAVGSRAASRSGPCFFGRAHANAHLVGQPLQELAPIAGGGSTGDSTNPLISRAMQSKRLGRQVSRASDLAPGAQAARDGLCGFKLPLSDSPSNRVGRYGGHRVFTLSWLGVHHGLSCTMRYTQGQVRDLLDISVDAFRVWREAIPALAVHKGHGPTFTPGEIVALATLADVIQDFGVRVNSIRQQCDDMFLACRGMSWQSLKNCVVTINSDTFRLVIMDNPREPLWEQPMICVPCAPIVDRLQGALMASGEQLSQRQLRFPPTAAGQASLR